MTLQEDEDNLDFVPEAIVPCQFFAVTDPQRGEKTLRLAVLDDAIKLLSRHAVKARSTRSHRQEEIIRAIEWVQSDATEWPYSYSNVCEALSIDPFALRRVLMRMMEDPAAPKLKRNRRTVSSRQRVEVAA